MLPLGVPPDQSGLASRVALPPCEAGKSAGCTALAAGLQRAKEMEITGTAPSKETIALLKLIKSLR
jgi:hypothetical protein